MSTHTQQVVQKLWNYCNILRDDGMSYGDYVEQLTYLLFLKMAYERRQLPFAASSQDSRIPEECKKQLSDDGRHFYNENKANIAALQGYKRVMKEIKGMIREQAEYSAAARAMLKMYRTYPWVEELLTAS